MAEELVFQEEELAMLVEVLYETEARMHALADATDGFNALSHADGKSLYHQMFDDEIFKLHALLTQLPVNVVATYVDDSNAEKAVKGRRPQITGFNREEGLQLGYMPLGVAQLPIPGMPSLIAVVELRNCKLELT